MDFSQLVSIRSRPEGREELDREIDDDPDLAFQSAPDPKAGRNHLARPRRLRAGQFQSAPDPKAGRNGSPSLPSGWGCSFNPLPTRRPGGTSPRRGRGQGPPVSIRSRPEGREEPPDNAEPTGPASFNPLPTRRPGGTGLKCRIWYRLPVSIRSRPEGREELAISARPIPRRKWFQSAPDPKAGRNHAATLFELSIGEFQSAPDPKAGRNPEDPDDDIAAITFQSAPDPKAGRNILNHATVVAALLFQSAPDPKAGRNTCSGGRRTGGTVSIRSRPEGREELGELPQLVPELQVSIRSRPEGREERKDAAHPSASAMFQSAPDPKAGRNSAATASRVPIWSFNPLPTRRPGGTATASRSRPATSVSIRSRPEGREEPGGTVSQSGVSKFQSAPDPKAGRNRRSSSSSPRTTGFNPLPTRRPGGTYRESLREESRAVSIRSRPEGREEPPGSRGPLVLKPCFNPLPTRRPGGTRGKPRSGSGKSGFNPLPTRRPGGTSRT